MINDMQSGHFSNDEDFSCLPKSLNYFGYYFIGFWGLSFLVKIMLINSFSKPAFILGALWLDDEAGHFICEMVVEKVVGSSGGSLWSS